MNQRFWYGLGAMVIVALVFQLFFRYQYVPQNAAIVWRVDRLTGTTCKMPCYPRSAAATQLQQQAIDNMVRPVNNDAASPRATSAVDALLSTTRPAATNVTQRRASVAPTTPKPKTNDPFAPKPKTSDPFATGIGELTPKPKYRYVPPPPGAVPITPPPGAVPLPTQ